MYDNERMPQVTFNNYNFKINTVLSADWQVITVTIIN